MKIRDLGKHGIGIEIREGDEFVIPANFLSISANPLKSSGNLYRPGLAWFIELVFAADVFEGRGDFIPYLTKQVEQYDAYLRKSQIFEDCDFDDPEKEDLIFKVAEANKGTRMVRFCGR